MAMYIWANGGNQAALVYTAMGTVFVQFIAIVSWWRESWGNSYKVVFEAWSKQNSKQKGHWQWNSQSTRSDQTTNSQQYSITWAAWTLADQISYSFSPNL